MSITTYSELKAAIEDFIERGDLTSRAGDFVALFEACANRRLRVRQQEVSTTLSPSSGSVSLPTDYLAWRHVTRSGSEVIELDYVHPTYMLTAYPSSASGTASVFTIEGSTLKVRPVDSTSLAFDYYQKVTALSDSVTSNWLLTAHPDLYLFGSLVEASMYSRDADPRAVMWKQRRDELFDEIEKLSNKTRGPGAVRVLGPTP